MSTRCIRTRRYKLVQHVLTGEEEFFDLEEDRFELRNLNDDAAHERKRNRLRDKLVTWGKQTPQATVADHHE